MDRRKNWKATYTYLLRLRESHQLRRLFSKAPKPWGNSLSSNGFDPANDFFNRFAFGIPPQKNGDYAFLLHILACLKSNGKGAVILPHGVLFRGGAEAAIRNNIVQRGYVKAIIGLPANLFYGTGIPACIIVLDKEKLSLQFFVIEHLTRTRSVPTKCSTKCLEKGD